jgi:hypothetical protein
MFSQAAGAIGLRARAPARARAAAQPGPAPARPGLLFTLSPPARLTVPSSSSHALTTWNTMKAGIWGGGGGRVGLGVG